MSVATQSQTASGTWVLDKVHSTVRYEIEHNGAATYRGNFNEIDASLEYGDDGVKIRGSVRVDSVDLKDETQKGHVLSPDFFDAERYATIDFASTDVQLDGHELVVNGELTIRGQSRPVSLRGTINGPSDNIAGGQTVSVSLHTTIDRNDYGVSWQAELPNGSKVLGDQVYVSAEFELVQA